MLKKMLITAVIALQGASFCYAQTPPNPPAPTPAVENPHKVYDQKARACKKLATEQGLTGDERRTFVAKCVKQ
jgi:hypothetical protein